MAIETRISNFMNKRKWIIPLLFILMVVYFITTIIILEVRNFANSHPRNAFSIGGELCAMIVAIMMTLSILPSYKRHNSYNRIFVTLLTVGVFALFLDSLSLIFDRDPNYRVINQIAVVLTFTNSSVYLYFFWLYSCSALKSTSKTANILNYIASVLLVVNMILPFVNFFYPLYFEINEAGAYTRIMPGWIISQNYVIFIAIIMTINIIISKEKLKTKLVISAFALIPAIAILVAGYANVPDGEPTVTVQYTAMMVSLVLIYAFLFSDNERNLQSKNKELGIATSIQKNMLPSIFPAFPDRKEFDVYASMTPAKEVGGDFYDFFLVDETHLGLVIADVSDKGIPAALFMMACKIMVQNYAMLAKTPKEVLSAVNKQICTNNPENMFVTVWLGVLDLKTGVLTACNAGHEKPVLKKTDGDFEVYADKHCFIVGGSDMAVYKEYELKLEKGTKLFLYTDGVPEAYNGSERFGMDRMIEALNKNKDKAPKDILAGMTNAIDVFVGNQDQFDDTTMLCLEYRGYGDE